MGNGVTPYIARNPGDLLSAGDWNQVQVDIKKDIADQIETAVGKIESVPHADDADKLQTKTLEEITQDILNKVLEAVSKKSGNYLRIFKQLEPCKERIITHGFKSCPLVDVYQLDYFPAVCANGETIDEERATWVNFYLYHATERRIRIPGGGTASTGPATVDIEPGDTQLSRLKFSDLLTLYGISYTDTTDLEELEASFWAAFFAGPNDEFDADQYCHSPWFEKCCGERRSVKELKDRQDWDRIYLKWMPRKTINFSPTGSPCTNATPPTQITVAPSQVQVSHYDFDTIGVRLIDKPTYPDDQTSSKDAGMPALPQDFQNELKVMVLLKA
jgi:hypothetical protein